VFDNEEQSNFNTALDLVSHQMEKNEIITSPLLDSNEIISAEESLVCDAYKSPISSPNNVEDTEDASVDMSQVHRKWDFAFKNVTSQLHNASFPTTVESKSSMCNNILSYEGNSEVKESGEASDIPRNHVPVGFNAVEVLSDAELHQYLQELEDNDKEFETGQEDVMGGKTKNGISLSSECQESSFSNSEVDSNKEELVAKSYKAEGIKHDGNFESLRSSTEMIGIENETDVTGNLADNFSEEKSPKSGSSVNTEMLKCPASSENTVPLQQVSSVSYSLDNNSTNSTAKALTCVVDNHTENKGGIPTVPGFTSVSKPITVSHSVISNAVKIEIVTEPIAAANIPLSKEFVVSDSDPPAAPPVPNSTAVASKTSSVITNLVSIDCQQITESSDKDGRGNDGYLINGSELHKTVEDITDNTEVNKSETETPDSIANETKPSESQESVFDSEKMDRGMLPQNCESSSILNNQVTNFDSAEDGLSTPEIILSSNKTSSFGKDPNELVQVLGSDMPQPSIVDSIPEKDISHKHSDNESDNSRAVVMDVSEVGFSEVQSCLVRMPRDGTTINVLGEEERPSRPKYLFLPSKITVENEQEDSENSDESPPVSGAVGKLNLKSSSF